MNHTISSRPQFMKMLGVALWLVAAIVARNAILSAPEPAEPQAIAFASVGPDR